ncbi:MAG: tRNA dihydrouridine synthase DusB [Ignavibacteriales bacterium]
MRLGEIEVFPPALLAPMAGVTDRVFRTLARRLGSPLSFTEMVSDKGLVHANRESLKIIALEDEEKPVGVQIFGSTPSSMAEAARIAESKGASLIDINMGCPVPKVVKSGAGAALMLDVRLAARIMERVRATVGIPVTAKIRKGWDEETSDPARFARALESAGASAITVHGRTRAQGYSGRADWGAIEAVKRAITIPVIGNGDVDGPSSLIRLMERTGCDGAMIGRAALGNPWIFRQIAATLSGATEVGVPVEERVATIIEHLRMMVEEYGERTAVPRMRKHFVWYTKGLTGAARLRRLIMEASTAARVERIAQMMLEQEDADGPSRSAGS